MTRREAARLLGMGALAAPFAASFMGCAARDAAQALADAGIAMTEVRRAGIERTLAAYRRPEV